MTVIPIVRSSNITASIVFYTRFLDFELAEGDSTQSDPGFATLKREGHYVYVSSYSDGVFGHALVVIVSDLNSQFQKLRARGIETPPPGTTPSPVHEGPVDQTWGTREFYVNDPDGNTVRFVQLS